MAERSWWGGKGTRRRPAQVMGAAGLVVVVVVAALVGLGKLGSGPTEGAEAVTTESTASSTTTTTTAAPTTIEASTTTEPPPPPTTPAPATIAPPPPPPPPPPRDPVITVYGDSIMWEARAAIAYLARTPVKVRVEAQGGAALCDFGHRIIDNARSEPTRLVVIGFTGNVLTPCMGRVPASYSMAQQVQVYVNDLDWILGELQQLDVPVLLVGAPPTLMPDGNTFWTPLNGAWIDAAARWRAQGMAISYADAGLSVADADGNWTETLPCLPGEDESKGCVDGFIAVRAADQGHFCPTVAEDLGGVVPQCPVWSSGAWRYGGAVAQAIQQRM